MSVATADQSIAEQVTEQRERFGRLQSENAAIQSALDELRGTPDEQVTTWDRARALLDGKPAPSSGTRHQRVGALEAELSVHNAAVELAGRELMDAESVFARELAAARLPKMRELAQRAADAVAEMGAAFADLDRLRDEIQAETSGGWAHTLNVPAGLNAQWNLSDPESRGSRLLRELKETHGAQPRRRGKR